MTLQPYPSQQQWRAEGEIISPPGAVPPARSLEEQTGRRRSFVRPSSLSLLFHAIKTARLVGAILQDRRVPGVRKLAFVGIMALLFGALLFPDALAEVAANILPVIGPILGIPIDASVDWAVLVVAGFNLLKLFPADIVGEHYDRLFRKE